MLGAAFAKLLLVAGDSGRCGGTLKRERESRGLGQKISLLCNAKSMGGIACV